MKLSKYITNVLIGFDQFINTIFLGFPDETISSRAWRCKDASSFWKVMRKFIELLFFFQQQHCFKAYLAEINRKQIQLEILKRV